MYQVPVWNSNGKYAGAFQFDGTDDYIEVLYSDTLNVSTEVTIMAWVKSDQSGRYVLARDTVFNKTWYFNDYDSGEAWSSSPDSSSLVPSEFRPEAAVRLSIVTLSVCILSSSLDS